MTNGTIEEGRTSEQKYTAQTAFDKLVVPVITITRYLEPRDIYSGTYTGLRVLMQWDKQKALWCPKNRQFMVGAEIDWSKKTNNLLLSPLSIYTLKGSTLLACSVDMDAKVKLNYFPDLHVKDPKRNVGTVSAQPSWILLTPADYLAHNRNQPFDANSPVTGVLLVRP